MKFIALMEP